MRHITEFWMVCMRLLAVKKNWDDQNLCDGTPLKLSLTHRYPNGNTFEGDIKDILEQAKLLDVTVYEEESDKDTKAWLEEHRLEVLCDKHPEWQLGGVFVSFNRIELGYGNIITNDQAKFVIVNVSLHLTVETARSRLGFIPVYHVINTYWNGMCHLTRVDEDLGYMHRTVEFEDDSSNHIRHHSPIRVTEYYGI